MRALQKLRNSNKLKNARQATSSITTMTQQMKNHQAARAQSQLTSGKLFNLNTSCASSTSNKMSFIIVSLLALLVSMSALSARSSDAKPLNQNQVRFRRLPPKEFSSLIGSSITIECEAGASPPPTIHWLKDGKRIQQTLLDENQLDDGQQLSTLPVDDINRIALSSTRSRLFIDCADAHDEATYTCVAENAYSRVASNTRLTIIRPLLVQAAAVAGSDNSLLAGSELVGSSADVAPSSGMAAADQEAAELSALPQCLSQQRNSRAAEPARIHMWTHNIVEIMKNDVLLYCRSNVNRRQQQAAASPMTPEQQTLTDLLISSELTAQQQQQQAAAAATTTNAHDNSKSPAAAVSWTLPDHKLVSHEQHRDKYEILDTGDLLIKDLRWEDMGSYVCTVSNELGSDAVSTFVYPASVKSAKSKRATSRAAD